MPQSLARRLRSAVRRPVRRSTPSEPTASRPSAPRRRPRVTLVETARRAGWKPTRPRRAFFEDLAAACSGLGRPAVVAVLEPPAGIQMSDVVSSARPRARVTRLDPDTEASALHTALAAAGPFDVVVDASRSGSDRDRLFRDTFLHVRPGGSYLVWNFGLGTQGLTSASAGESVLGLVARLSEIGARGVGVRRTDTLAKRSRRTNDWTEHDEAVLAWAIRSVHIGPRHLTVVSRARALAKLTEEATTEVLEVRGPSTGRTLDRLDPVQFVSRSTVTHVPASRTKTSPRVAREITTFDVPAMSLREYADAVCQPGQVATLGNLVLPDTFRHGRRKRLGYQTRMRELGQRFAVPEQAAEDVTDLEGAYFFLDSEFRGHYGHAMTEQLSRLWAWPQAKEREPGLRALMTVSRWGPQLHEFERVLYGAAGIPPEDLVLVEGPVRVERLIGATPMFSQPQYVHPDLDETWTRVSRALAAQASGRDYPRRIFCARRRENRACLNSEEVEGMFERFGFTVVYPERFSLPEQAMMFRSADVLAGYAGSAMINTCLTEAPKRVVLVASDGYTAKNEYLIAAVLGHRLDVVWCAAETPMPPKGWSPRAFGSPFSMDFDAEGRELERILASLDVGSDVDA